MSLKNILEETLSNTATNAGLSLRELEFEMGGGKDTKLLEISEEDKERLLKNLNAESKFNNKIIVSIITLHFALFALCVFFAFYYRDHPEILKFLFGGSLLSLMVIMYSLIKLLKFKNFMDVLRFTLPNLSPKDAIDLVKATYFNLKRRIF